MPIYEYGCEACGAVVEVLVLKQPCYTKTQCPNCGGSAYKKVSAHAKTASKWEVTERSE